MSEKKLILHDTHVAAGGQMIPFAGYLMPVRYSSDIEEHMTVRQGVGVFDVSHMGEFFLQGPQALALIQRLTSNDAAKLFPGRAQYSCMPNGKGGIVDDLIVYMLEENRYMLVVNAANEQKDWDWISSHNDQGVSMTNATDQYCLFAVQGPKATSVLQQLTDIDLGAIKYYHFTIGSIAGASEVIISATGYTGSGGFELYVKNEDAQTVWDNLFAAGAAAGIKPIGLGARDTLRLEMGFCLYGNDIDETTSPIEAGLGWITKFTKDFIDRERLQKQKEEGVSRKLVGFVMQDRGIPRHGYELQNEAGEVIGHVTSGSQSPMLGQGIGMGYVQTAYASEGTDIWVAVRKRKLRARVTRPPFVQV
ncbi:MAG TPA: glycine cleavage system aminomethyltransferase GcvT [Flammeovirgaceae bacterium]|nr:glycine cleavage system aminomethyltransferase GcvT [Flammeovirgaceae bacterium]